MVSMALIWRSIAYNAFITCTSTVIENQNLTPSFQVIIKVYRDIKEIQLRKYYKASEEGKNAIEISPTKVRIVPPNKSDSLIPS